MSVSSNYGEEALVGRESLFRQKLSQLRTTGEIKRLTTNNNLIGFKEIERNIYLNNVSSSNLKNNPQHLEKLALLDSLTELYNHNTIVRMLKDEVKRALRYKKELSVLAISLDDLVQEAQDPMIFDCAFRKMAQLIMSHIRDVDIPGRYDKERILILCPETTKTGAAYLAKRLDWQINLSQNFDSNDSFTISIGLVTFPTSAQNDQHMLALAFQALSLAQSTGGNTIRIA